MIETLMPLEDTNIESFHSEQDETDEEIVLALNHLNSEYEESGLDHGSFNNVNLLWKNPDLFVNLPFKLNEDINPTKANPLGMRLVDLALPSEE
ncbi:hypothetical protein L6164_023787 [Bauhinia variegata]|uniref:Uncharacterized protein n=1 Tax=Bauhinia variegata TaxID=167791 RepID=A0ACB9MJR4_BAUVA|nr:hypothetical protein L6164_023787 [Bauhinia variegata]